MTSAVAVWAAGVLLGLVALGTRRQGVRQVAIVGLVSLWSAGAAWVAASQTVSSSEDVARPRPVSVPTGDVLVPLRTATSPASAVDDGTLSVPWDGDRSMVLPVTVVEGETHADVDLMLDTGATLTNLPSRVVRALGVDLDAPWPTLKQVTGNGAIRSRVVMVDALWIGDLELKHVAVAVNDGLGDESDGVIGLNVASAFDIHVDNQRKEMSFTPRPDPDRVHDVEAFTRLVTRWRSDGSVEVGLHDRAPWGIAAVTAKVTCGTASALVDVGPVEAGRAATVEARLPFDADCERHAEIVSARWQ